MSESDIKNRPLSGYERHKRYLQRLQAAARGDTIGELAGEVLGRALAATVEVAQARNDARFSTEAGVRRFLQSGSVEKMAGLFAEMIPHATGESLASLQRGQALAEAIIAQVDQLT